MEELTDEKEEKKALNGKCIEIRIKVGGIYQRKKFELSKIKHPQGMMKCLIADNNVIPLELLKIANEYNIPVKNSSVTVFPKGKTAKDFISSSD